MTPPTERIRETGQKQKTCSCGFPVCYLDTQYIFMPLSHLEAVRHIHTYPKKYSLALPLAPEPLNDQENPVCKENIMSSLRVIHALCKATKKALLTSEPRGPGSPCGPCSPRTPETPWKISDVSSQCKYTHTHVVIHLLALYRKVHI